MSDDQQPARGPDRRAVLLRLDPAVHEAVSKLAADEMRSVNAQVELLIRDGLKRRGRLPKGVAPLPRIGRPPKV